MSHPIPDQALDADLAILAQKGAGKTYLARGLAERLLDMGRRVIVMDPLDSWWGLKARADGTPGYPVVVIGGPHADLPLDPKQAERLGEYLAGAEVSAVIDTSELRRGEMLAFASVFLRTLYRLNRKALWLVLEEADVFAPQNPMKDATMLLHEVEQIARRGRARGFRLVSITQRPARLHKDVLTQASTLALLRIRAPQDRAAVEDWVRGNADASQARTVTDSLASLDTGEGWVWAPDLDILQRGRFPAIQTLDTSFTPQPGQTRPELGPLPQIDVSAIARALGAPAVKPPSQDLEAVRQEAYARGVADGMARARQQVLAALGAAVPESQTPEPAPEPPVGVALTPTTVLFSPPTPAPATSLPRPSQTLIDALGMAEALFGRRPIERDMLAFLAEVSPVSSGYANNLGSLRALGLIDYPTPGMVLLTDTGRASARSAHVRPSNDSVQRAVLERLTKPQRRLLEVLLEEHPKALTRDCLANRAGVSVESSGFANNLSRLRSLKLAEYPRPGQVAAAALLFPFSLETADDRRHH